jgi:multimeric flavodoxin WrbA
MNNPVFSRAIIINGSARTEGETACLVHESISCMQLPLEAHEVVELCTLNISPYDYEARNQKDDFLPLIERCCACSHIIIATPLYWYTVSTHTKIFLDRFTDLLHHHRELKSRLAGRRVGVMTSFASRTPEVMVEARAYMDWMFQGICNYMQCAYLGSYFHHNREEYPIQQERIAPLFS